MMVKKINIFRRLIFFFHKCRVISVSADVPEIICEFIFIIYKEKYHDEKRSQNPDQSGI
jgi:hypothetical protein